LTEFTIILPTTGDRGLTLEWVLPHVRLQSVDDWELLVIGDGIDAGTRACLERWSALDSRIRFFEHPKDVRRGETYRHEALRQARGRFVAYLTDRDLWLHDHLESLCAALAERDFAHTQAIHIQPDGQPASDLLCNLERAQQHAQAQRRGSLPVTLSSVGHTLESYRRLPFGWRTTPRERKTDQYMWHQFLREGAAKCRSLAWPTLLYFNRGDHPGWPSAERAHELADWHARMADVEAQEHFRAFALAEFARWPTRGQRALRSWLFWHPRWRDRYLRLRAALR
jgi:glycosyltransferase involved in cell wall biosynthesis